MKKDDANLIQRVLSGDESAFAMLVEKHQKWVHSLVWREIGDFHIAQEIAQDTFIQVFKSLPTLRNPDRFLGWLYVIAKRQCVKWLRKKPFTMESLNAMSKSELEGLSYTRYLDGEQVQASADALREVVKYLLQKLPVAERSVMILHYFRGLNCEEVGALLDISSNSVKSRLHRARKRLEEEESTIREILSPNLLKSESRCIGIKATAATETGKHLARGTFNFRQSDTELAFVGYGTTGTVYEPAPMYMAMHYIAHYTPYPVDLYRFPLIMGDAWEQKGHWNSRAKMTLEPLETVEVSAGMFRECIKHKTVFTGAEVSAQETYAEVKEANAFVDGTRCLWFAQGIGFVKMRYEHANGVITEAELLEYKFPVRCKEYLPSQVGTQWTYKWQNNYRDKAVIERCSVVESSDKPMKYDLSR